MSKHSNMKVAGDVGSERAPRDNGEEVKHGPFYTRSVSMKALDVNSSAKEMISLVRSEEVSEGSFKFSVYNDKGCILPTKGFGPRFKATLLEKVRLEDDFSEVDEEFYPTVKRLMDASRNWGVEFIFLGLSSFVDLLMEWTERILRRHVGILRQANIYGLVGASQYPYHYDKDVWKAFCEHWSSLTNTLHHGGGEVGISLNDLKQICGLPILGEPYEEYFPLNKLLLDNTMFPPTVVELLRIHAKLCDHEGAREISWYKWVSHFYRGKQNFTAFGEPHPSSTKRNPPPISSGKGNLKKSLPLRVSPEGELAVFLSLLLSRFVLPGKNKSIRTKTFLMASVMAQGKQVALAPAVLGHIYHGLGKMAMHPGNPGSAKPSFGIHFVIGWLGEYFPSLYRCRPDNEFRRSYPPLVRYVGVNGNNLDLYQARLLFRGTRHFFYRAVSFGAEVGSKDYIDSDDLSDLCFEHLISIRHCSLPVRLGATLIIEPYYPNRFARQFGFDQGFPFNTLNYRFSHRSTRSLEDINRAYARLFKKGTGTLFHIPFNYHQGTYTYTYCSWWARISTPYLAQSCSKVKSILLKKNCIEREPVFMITDLRNVTAGLQGAVWFSDHDDPITHSPPSVESLPQTDVNTSSRKKAGKRMVRITENLLSRESLSADVNPKRARYDRPAKSDSSNSVEFQGSPINDSCADMGVIVSVEKAPTIFDNTAGPSKLAIVTFPDSPTPNEKREAEDLLLSQHIPFTLKDVLSTTKNDWIHESISNGVGFIMKAILNLKSPEELIAERTQIMESIATLEAIIVVSHVNLTWFIQKVGDLFNIAEAMDSRQSMCDSKRIELLQTDLAQCSAELTTQKSKHSQLAQSFLTLKKDEAELTTLKERVNMLETRVETTKTSLTREDADIKSSIQLCEDKMRQLQCQFEQQKLIEAEISRAKKRDYQKLIAILTSFAPLH